MTGADDGIGGENGYKITSVEEFKTMAYELIDGWDGPPLPDIPYVPPTGPADETKPDDLVDPEGNDMKSRMKRAFNRYKRERGNI